MSEKNQRNLVAETRNLRDQINALKKNLDMVDSTIKERMVTAETLTNLGKIEKDEEILVPIGSGSYIKATTKNIDEVLTGVGAGISIQKKRLQAIKSLNNQVNEFEKIKVKLTQNLESLSMRYQELQTQISQLSQGGK